MDSYCILETLSHITACFWKIINQTAGINPQTWLVSYRITHIATTSISNYHHVLNIYLINIIFSVGSIAGVTRSINLKSEGSVLQFVFLTRLYLFRNLSYPDSVSRPA